MSTPLDPIMDWYQVTLDSLRVTARVLSQNIRNAVLPKHTFYGEPTPESLERLEAAKLQVADLVVLTLVSTFERTIRDHL